MPYSETEQEKLINLGNRVRQVRLDMGLTLKDLAHRIGKDIQSVQRLEKGNINPSYLYLSEICAGLDIDLAELLR